MAELVNLSIPETQSNNRDPRQCEGLETQEEKITLHSSTRNLFESKQPARGGHDSAMAACMHVYLFDKSKAAQPAELEGSPKRPRTIPKKAFRTRQKLKPQSPRVSGVGFQLNVFPCWSRHGGIRTRRDNHGGPGRRVVSSYLQLVRTKELRKSHQAEDYPPARCGRRSQRVGCSRCPHGSWEEILQCCNSGN